LQAGYNFSSHVLAVAPAAIIGITAGLFAIVFTELNLAIVRLRDKLLGA
jgi:H+/Cl- antiporter ClcA